MKSGPAWSPSGLAGWSGHPFLQAVPGPKVFLALIKQLHRLEVTCQTNPFPALPPALGRRCAVPVPRILCRFHCGLAAYPGSRSADPKTAASSIDRGVGRWTPATGRLWHCPLPPGRPSWTARSLAEAHWGAAWGPEAPGDGPQPASATFDNDFPFLHRHHCFTQTLFFSSTLARSQAI